MTAEVVIMNREGIALAADSAVSTNYEAGNKIFTSANKLFVLSKYDPIAIMIYGRADFVAVPWEIIIKLYRKRLGKSSFRTTREYADDFLNYVGCQTEMFTEDQQLTEIHSWIVACYLTILDEVQQKMEEVLEEQPELMEDDAGRRAVEFVEQISDSMLGSSSTSNYDEASKQEIAEKYRAIIDKLVQDVFGRFPIGEVARDRLTKLAVEVLAQFHPDTSFLTSGIVIAGYGKAEIFPHLVHYSIGGMVLGQIKYREEGSFEINVESDAMIMPFAQVDMVCRFVEGADPDYKKTIGEDIELLFSELPSRIIGMISELTDAQKRQYEQKVSEVISRPFLEGYTKHIESYQHSRFIDRILKILQIMPRDEMATMAEALVSITSLQRRVSTQSETVAGPVDVAIISKGDGFVWKKRKFYFPAELNPHFMHNYYTEAGDGKDTEV